MEAGRGPVKPPVERGHLGDFANIVEETMVRDMRCAVGFQYRWHPRLHLDNWRRYRHIKFYAQDDLVQRYCATCLETMVSHPLDAALQIRCNPKSVDMITDGIYTAGALFYPNGESTDFSLHMNRSPRVSQIYGGCELVHLDPDDTMYVNAFRGWLDWLDGGARDWRTATLEDGFEVMRIMEQVRDIQKEII